MEQPDNIECGNRPEEVVLTYAAGNGRPYRFDTFNTVRAGISWPGPETPGYYCIFGLKNISVPVRKKPLVLLNEGERAQLDDFFERYAIRTRKYLCSMAFANLEESPGFEDSLRRFRDERKMDVLMPYDSSEFEYAKFAVSLVNQRMRDGALAIPQNGIMGRQVGTMIPEDIKGATPDRFYAVLALFRVLGSFEYYPWSKGARNVVRFTNFIDRQRSKWDGRYQEFNAE